MPHSSRQRLDVLYLAAAGAGWGPIDELATLTARLLQGRLLTVRDRGEVSLARKATSLLPRIHGKGRTLLVIAANPALLAYAARPSHWLPGYERTAAWVIDSFWTERISRFAIGGRHFDDLFITDRDLVDEWAERTSTPTHWAPWGTDTLAFPNSPHDRPVDLLRLGRQPPAWDDDAALLLEAASHGLRAAGRPPMGRTGAENQRIVRDALASTKFVLAFSNLLSPAPYTHPTRDYITGRWLDALAAGAAVVGAAPHNASDVLWDGATIEIDPEDRDAGLHTVAELTQHWLPESALLRQTMAQVHLDWRHRLASIANELNIHPTPDLEIERSQLATEPDRRATIDMNREEHIP